MPTGIQELGTDIGALANGYVSVTPVHLDLTAYQSMPDLNNWEWADENKALVPVVASLFVAG